MAKEIEVFWGPGPEQLATVRGILGKLPGVSLRSVYVAKLLDDLVMLPFIQVDDGSRYYGIDSIRKYAEESARRGEKVPA